MTIPKDKILHFALGVLAILCALVALTIHAWFGLGPTLAYTTTVTGVLYEVQQWYRKEGQPDLLDALATAAPGWVAWAFLEFL
jgi:hypothetical protein